MSKLTDIRGVGPARAAVLAASGFASVEALAEARPEDLAGVNGIGLPLATEIIRAARAMAGKEGAAPESEAVKPPAVAPALKPRAARGRAGAVKRKPRAESLRKTEKRAKPATAVAPAVPDVPLPPVCAGSEPGSLKKAKVRAKAAKALKKAEALAKAFEAAEKKAKKKAKKAKKKEKEAKALKKAAKAKG